MRHILMVDDEPEVLEGLEQILGSLPEVTLHTAQYASSAIQIMQTIDVSLVIADIHMPGMNGIQMWDEIQRHYDECRVIFLSGVRDFDNIYRVIQNPKARYLTKMEPEEKILSVVEEVLDELEDEKWQKDERKKQAFLTCLTSNEKEFANAIRYFEGIVNPAQWNDFMSFMLISLPYGWAMSKTDQNAAMTMLSKIAAMELKMVEHSFLQLDNNHAVIVYQGKNQSESETEQIVQRIIDRSSASVGMPYGCVWGYAIEALRNLILICRDVLQWENHSNMMTGYLLTYREIDRTSAGYDRTALDKLSFNQEVLKSYLVLGQKEQFCKLAQKTLNDAIQKGIHSGLALYTYIEIRTMLIHHLNGMNQPALLQKISERKPFSLRNTDEWNVEKTLILRCCEQVFDALHPVDPYSNHDIIASIQHFICDHLDCDLSLNALSIQFNMTPNYLSRFFHENTGYKLHDYITNMRLGRAEHLIVTTATRINEIAKMVGYDSTHTFIRAFRRYYGSTPADYRSKRS